MTDRRERVVLTLDDRFSAGMTRAAAAAALLNRELDRLDRRRLGGGGGPGGGGSDDLDRIRRNAQGAGNEIDRLSGRVKILAQTATLIGPAFVPLGAVAIPAVTGLATQLGFAAAAGGTAILAFQGVGDALKAVNKAQLEPTTANLTEARTALEALSPAAAGFVKELRSLSDVGASLRDSAAEGLFPGLTEALDTIQTRVPQAERILFNLGNVLGDIASGSAASLASGRWDDFFNFLEADARDILTDLADSVGNLGHAFTNLIIQTEPLSAGFSDWLVEATARFDAFTATIGQSDGFAEFLDYVRTNGPIVADAVGAISQALLDIVEAAAPIGGPVLEALGSLAKIVSLIADSDMGTPLYAAVAAMSALSLATRGFAASGASAWASNIRGAETMTARLALARGALIRTAGGIAGLAAVSSGAAGKIGLQNTALYATAGLMVGGPWGAAIGGGIGLIADFAGGQQDAAINTDSLNNSLNQQTGALTQATAAQVAKNLQDSGAADAAERLGISYETLAGAATGNAGALAILNGQLETAKDGFYDTEGRILVGAAALQTYRDDTNAVTGAVDENSSAIASGQSEIEQRNKLMAGVAGSTDQATNSTQAFTASMIALDNFLNKRGSFVAYEQSIDDATKAMRENGRTLDINTQKGRDNRTALDRISASAKSVAETLKGGDRVKFLTQARKDVIDAAMKFGATKKQAQSLGDQLIEVGKIRARPTITVDSGQSRAEIAAIRNLLKAIPDENVNVNVTRHTNANVAEADRGYASGGTVPKGGVYRDKYRYLLAPGEEVISNRHGQADRHRLLLKAINAGRAADGATIGGSRYYSGSSGAGAASRELNDLAKGAHDSRKALLEEAKQRRDNLAQAKASLRSTVTDSLRSDIFAVNSDPWASTGADPLAALRADTANARAFNAARKRLKAKGLNGQALQEALSHGLGVAQDISGESRAYLANYERAYNTRQRVTARAGAASGEAVYGAQIRGIQQQIAHLTKAVQKSAKDTGDHVAKGLNDASNKATRGQHRG